MTQKTHINICVTLILFILALFVVGCIPLWIWYCEWLGNHFLGEWIAFIVGLVTIPLCLIAPIVEWIWHGWPHNATLSLVLSIICICLMIVTGAMIDLPTEEKPKV